MANNTRASAMAGQLGRGPNNLVSEPNDSMVEGNEEHSSSCYGSMHGSPGGTDLLPHEQRFRTIEEEQRSQQPEEGKMAWILIAIAVVTLWVVSLYRILSSSSASVPSNPRFLSNGDACKKKNVLVVVAHPDDESMFFAPTILFLASEGHILHILCLSTGNADGKGNVRKEELYRACAVFKVPPQKVKILDHPNLQDGFGNQWDHQLIAKIVEEEIEMYSIDSLITFDRFGVSGHQNHRDVYHGLCVLLREDSKRDIEVWELVSTSILRKYSGPVDIWLSTCFRSCDKERTYSLMNKHPGVTYLAMAEHDSQWIWFRKLFVLFSSYTYINTLRKINM